MIQMQMALMTEIEARLLVDEIKSDISKTGQKLLELYEREGWRALGYTNWRDCVMTEFDFQQSRVYQLLDFARIERNLSTNGGNLPLPTSERQARPLTKLEPEVQREVWPIVVDTAPNGHITANHVQQVVDNYNYKRDNRHSQPSDIYTPQGMDACQTPAYAIDPLLPYLPEGLNIWEPACGEGLLEDALIDSGFSVVSGDLITGQNFFEYEPDNWDAIVTNPPYSIHFQWLERCYQLGKPFALLLKVEILGTKTAQEMFEQYGIEIILVSPRINFKMPNKGWDGGGAQFPTAWFTWGLNIGRQLTFKKVFPDDPFN